MGQKHGKSRENEGTKGAGNEVLEFLRDGRLNGGRYRALLGKYGGLEEGATMTRKAALRFVEECNDSVELPHFHVLTQWVEGQERDSILFEDVFRRVLDPLVKSYAVELTTSVITEVDHRLFPVEASGKNTNNNNNTNNGVVPHADWRLVCSHQSNSPVGSCPRDVLALIIGQTGTASDIAKCARVCKQFYLAASVVLQWLRPSILQIVRYHLRTMKWPLPNENYSSTLIKDIGEMPPGCGVVSFAAWGATDIAYVDLNRGVCERIASYPGGREGQGTIVKSLPCSDPKTIWIETVAQTAEAMQMVQSTRHSYLECFAFDSVSQSMVNVQKISRIDMARLVPPTMWGVIQGYAVAQGELFHCESKKWFPCEAFSFAPTVVVASRRSASLFLLRRRNRGELDLHEISVTKNMNAKGMLSPLADGNLCSFRDVCKIETTCEVERQHYVYLPAHVLVFFEVCEGFFTGVVTVDCLSGTVVRRSTTGYLPPARGKLLVVGPSLVMLVGSMSAGTPVGIVHFLKVQYGVWSCSKLDSSNMAEPGLLLVGQEESGVVYLLHGEEDSMKKHRSEGTVVAALMIDKGSRRDFLPSAVASGDRHDLAVVGRPMRVADHALTGFFKVDVLRNLL